MTLKNAYSILLALFLGLALTQGTLAKDGTDPAPSRTDRVAKQGTHHIKSLAKRGCRHSRKTAARCVNAIEGLLENGNADRAAQVGQRSTNRISRKAKAVTKRIEKISDRCTNLLTEHEATEQADAVSQASQEAVDKVRQCANDAAAAIEAALGSASGPGGPSDGQ